MNSQIKRLALATGAVGATVAGILHVAPLEPPEMRLVRPGTVLLDASGEVIHRDLTQGLRIPVTLDQVSPLAIQATVAAEDQRFWTHPGVDPFAMARAAFTRHGGASTVTQQLARRLYLRDFEGPAWARKAREVLLALQLEARYSKRELLRLYLNEVYYGRGAYGIEAAARVYFGVSALDLDLARAAMLAGMPQLPAVYDPTVAPEIARRRQGYVLRRLVDLGRTTDDDARRALAEPLEYLPLDPDPIAPHFIRYVLEQLGPLGDHPGLLIETTLDANLQRQAVHSVKVHLEELQDHQAGNAAVVVLEPATGRILAMIGGADFFDERSGQVNLSIRPRQPGSALKPFVYAAAFERGMTPATPLMDVPTTFQTPQGPYSPLNYDRRFHGRVPLRVALASSFNIPAVRVLDQIGTQAFLDLAHRLGLHSLGAAEAYGPALALGGGEVTLLKLTAGYGALANGGALVPPVSLTRVRDTAGRVLYEADAQPRARLRRAPHAISPQHAYLLADILSDPAARVPGFGYAPALEPPFRAAVKTGTTTGSRDNWALGLTPDRVVGVWVGNADGSPMRDVSGVDGAGPIWRDVITAASAGLPRRWFGRPEDVIEQEVCSPTGLLPGPDCPTVVRELFVRGTGPAEPEGYYQRAPGVLLRNLEVEARPWAVDAGVAAGSTSSDEVHVVQPAHGAVLFLSPELPHQEVVLRAAVPSSAAEVEFRVDGLLVARTDARDPRAIWRLEAGAHSLEVAAHLNGRTAYASVNFEVRDR